MLGMNTKALGQPYYVARNGDDSNPGTLADPWGTIQKAANTLTPGDVVYVRGGVYHETVTLNVSGSANGGYITFRPYEDEIPILDGTELSVLPSHNGMFLIVDQQYIIIEGFEIRNYRTSTPDIVPVGIHIRGQAHHIQLRKNHIHHIETHAPVDDDLYGADAHGIAVYGTSAPESINNIFIENNELHDLILGSSEGVVLNGNVDQFTVTNNVIYNCDNIGIDIIGFEEMAPDPDYDQARNGVLSNNLVYDISSFGNPAYGDAYSAGGIYVDGGRDIVIERNTVYQSDIGIEIASEHSGRSTSHVTVRNNFLFYNRMTGIAMGGYDTEHGSTENCVLVNNTLYHNDTLGDGNGEILLQFDTRDNIIKNNIFYATDQNLLMANPFTENVNNVMDYNLYFTVDTTGSEWEWQGVIYQGLSAYQSGTGNDANSLFLAPQFADLDEPNLHLQATSPAMDAGENLPAVGDSDIDGQIRVQGDMVDIGADEIDASMMEPEPLSLPGDFDGDGTVGFLDFFQFADVFGQNVPPANPMFDLDGDGTVGFLDFFRFADNFGTAAQARLISLAQEYIGLPASPRLEQNYPNPFNSSTTIRYQIPQTGLVRLEIFDLAGQKVATLVEDVREAGVYTVRWDGRDDRGPELATGVYLYRLRAGEQTVETRKLLLLR